MDKKTVTHLLKKYTEGNCSAEEQALVDRWYLAEAAKRNSADPQNPIADRDRIWKGLQKQLALNTIDADDAEAKETEKHVKTIRLTRLKWMAAASVLLVASFFVYRFVSADNHEVLMAEIRKNDIAPGKNMATLTLPDGKTIKLSDNKTGIVIDARGLAYNDGARLNTHPAQSDTVQQAGNASITPFTAFSKKMMNVTTPRGGTYQVLLPDGSKVWLNAASSLSFPQEFDKQARVVMLIGEAYFEIAKKPEHPFRVMSIGQRVTVLGTHFNINAYRDEHRIKTTLIEGSVQVYAGASKEEVTLKPGQQTIMNFQDLKTTQANIEEVLAWKNGKFRFVNEDIKSIMEKISRWYDVDIDYRGDVTREKFSGQVSRFSNVSDILEVLQLTGFVHFKIENTGQKAKERRIVVLP